MNISQRLFHRRKTELGWSQTKLSEESGVSQQMISKLERAVAKGSTEIIALARALGVTPEWLEAGTEPKFPSELPNDELMLLENYRATPPALRPAVLRAAQGIREAGAAYSTSLEAA